MDAVVLLPVGSPQRILLRNVQCHCCILRGLDALCDLCDMDDLCRQERAISSFYATAVPPDMC